MARRPRPFPLALLALGLCCLAGERQAAWSAVPRRAAPSEASAAAVEPTSPAGAEAAPPPAAAADTPAPPPPPVRKVKKMWPPRGVRRNLVQALSLAGLAVVVNAAPGRNSAPYWDRVERTIRQAVPEKDLRVLEVGIGSAPNLQYYPKGTQLVGLDYQKPNPVFLKELRESAGKLGISVDWEVGKVGELPFKDNTFDAVVTTKVLCSVSDPQQALREISRVLVPGGRFGYVEHVAAHDGGFLEGFQVAADPIQQLVADNCHLHRDTDGMIHRSVAGAEGGGETLFQREEAAERYVVWELFPISQQAAGVVRK